MSYVIQAIVGRNGSLHVPVENVRVCQLRHGVQLLPLTKAVLEVYQLPALPLTDTPEQLEALPKIEAVCVAASEQGQVAYIEAEYIGGRGVQAAVLAERGVMVGRPLRSGHAINDALRFLGVPRDGAADEFEAVGLGRFRHTGEW